MYTGEKRDLQKIKKSMCFLCVVLWAAHFFNLEENSKIILIVLQLSGIIIVLHILIILVLGLRLCKNVGFVSHI